MTVELPGPLAKHIESFVGRTWLLPLLLDWLGRTDERLCLLTGAPGTGKTWAMAWLAGYGPAPSNPDARVQLEQIRAQVAAAHFCMAASGNVNPQAFAQHVAYQLTRSVPGFGEALTGMGANVPSISVSQRVTSEADSPVHGSFQILEIDMVGTSDESAFDRAFRGPLKTLYAQGYAEPVLVVVDALDEAQRYAGRVTLVQLMARIADLPPQVRILASTPPDPRVLKYFGGVRLIDLVDDVPETVDDVRLYVEVRLASSETEMGDEQRKLLANRICQAAQGNFLYAALSLDEVAAGRLPDVRELDDYLLPRGLGRLYHEYLNQDLGRDEQEWLEVFQPLLGLLAVAQPPGLTRRQLERVLGQDPAPALRACAQYIAGTWPEGPFRLYHPSFAHFLLDDPENVAYQIDRANVQRQLALHSNALDELKESKSVPVPRAVRTSPPPLALQQRPETAFGLPANVGARIEYFVGQTWLLPILLDWFESSDERTLLLTGAPGCGKSMVMAWLAGIGPEPASAEARHQLGQIRSHVKASHFCVAASGNASPRSFAVHIGGQLVRSVQSFADVLVASDSTPVQIRVDQHVDATAGGLVGAYMIERLVLDGIREEVAFQRLFFEPLKNLYAGGYAEPILILVDALNEALTYTGEITLVQLLANVADLPSQVRIVASTRPDPRVLKYFMGIPSVDLVKDTPKNVDDIRLYVNTRLDAMGAGILGEQRRLLANRISQAAQGIFLYADLVLSSLSCRSEPFDPASLSMPEGLDSLYTDFLNRELGQDEDRWYQAFGPLLGLLAVAQPPGFTRSRLERILGQEVESALRACTQFISGDLPGGPFRLYHQSLAHFLLHDQGNVNYHIDAATMHRRIARHYQVWCRGDWGMLDEYGARHLLRHLVGCDIGNKLRPIHVDEYGIRHLVFHAIAARRAAEIGKVIDLVLGE